MDKFIEVIKDYLDNLAIKDEMFSQAYANEKKTVEECCNYIIGAVEASGRQGFADDEVFALAVEYYVTEDAKAEDHKNCKVVINQEVTLSETEKEEARKTAINRYENEELAKLRKKEEKEKEKQQKKKEEQENDPVLKNQISMF